MSEIPPKQMPDTSSYDETGAGGGMVAMYNAASHANAESFPVLKAFQDYLEAERTQARKRVIQLSIFFAVLMGVVVTGFLSAGIFMLRNMTSMQNKLLDVALANRTAPAQAQAPAADESAKQMTRVATELQSHLDKKLDGVNEIANKVNDKVASQDGELEKLRGELRQMQEQSAQLKTELVAIKTEAKHPVSTFRPSAANFTPIAPRPTPSAAVASAPTPEPIVAAQPSVAVAQTPAAPAKTQLSDANLPAAVKEPPTTPTGVTPPPAPQGMMATAIPLKTKNVGTVPWRVLIPE